MAFQKANKPFFSDEKGLIGKDVVFNAFNFAIKNKAIGAKNGIIEEINYIFQNSSVVRPNYDPITTSIILFFRLQLSIVELRILRFSASVVPLPRALKDDIVILRKCPWDAMTL